MESQLEENASKELLDEVLQTSQEALEDEEEQTVASGFAPNLNTGKNGSPTMSPQVKSGPSSPTASSAVSKRSTLYPVSQSPGRGVDKNHIKSVWSSQPDHDVGLSSNSLKGIADELPQFSMPMQDLPEGKDEHEPSEHGKDLPNGGQEDADIPQFASVGAVKSTETVLSPRAEWLLSVSTGPPRGRSVTVTLRAGASQPVWPIAGISVPIPCEQRHGDAILGQRLFRDTSQRSRSFSGVHGYA